jgi:hypothetical protein
MENLIPFAIFGSSLAFAIMVLALIIIFIASDIEESGHIATLALFIALGFNYFWGNFPVLDFFTFKNISIYVFIGFLFSLVRTYFKGKELNKYPEEKKRFRLKEHVFRWWFLFPISAINWFFGHLLKDLFNFVYKGFEQFYDRIFNA